MVLYVIQLNMHPQKAEAYTEHVQQEIPRLLAAGGFTEMRGYRGAAGASQVVTTIEFADMAGWAAWYSSEEVQESLSQLRMLTLNLTTALWGPTPLMPEPLRPGS